MMSPLEKWADLWIRRYRAPLAARSEALAAVAGLRPAVVVTGGSRGIGQEIGRCFASAGHDVILVGRSEADLARAAAEITPPAKTVVATLSLDVTAADVHARLSQGVARHGCYIDVLVNCAGIGAAGPFIDDDPERLDAVAKTNMLALQNLCRFVLPNMLARGRGGILNVASLGAVTPGPYQAAYYASKAFVVSLTEAIAWEVRGQGVRVAAVLPGPVDTGFHRAMRATDNALYRRLLPQATAASTGAAAYRGYRLGRRVVVPGVASAMLFMTLKLLPHPVTIPIVAWLLKNRP